MFLKKHHTYAGPDKNTHEGGEGRGASRSGTERVFHPLRHYLRYAVNGFPVPHFFRQLILAMIFSCAKFEA